MSREACFVRNEVAPGITAGSCLRISFRQGCMKTPLHSSSASSLRYFDSDSLVKVFVPTFCISQTMCVSFLNEQRCRESPSKSVVVAHVRRCEGVW